MKNLKKLVGGYKEFLEKNYQAHMRGLAEHGQSPKIMVIGCSDSRVNPELIFNTKPGDLFMVRNVANLVPPYESDDGHHGTSAALEFAVDVLGVQHIVVMGHSSCGGVKACCDKLHGHMIEGRFIRQWTSILNACAQEVKSANPDLPEGEFYTKVEQAAIAASLLNLEGFPFIKARLNSGDLMLHGAYFDIGSTQLYALDHDTHVFMPVE